MSLMWTALYDFVTTNKLLNSTFLLALLTLAVGFTALYVYKKQKADEKQQAAVIVLTELRNATAVLPAIMAHFKQQDVATFPPGGIRLLSNESWSKYRYLFVGYLTVEEWGAVDRFYKYCAEYDKAEQTNSNYFSQNVGQIWSKLHDRYYAELSKQFKDKPDSTDVSETTSGLVTRFNQAYINGAGVHTYYQPTKAVLDAKEALDNINESILLTSVAGKLDDLAHRKRSTIRIFSGHS